MNEEMGYFEEHRRMKAVIEKHRMDFLRSLPTTELAQSFPLPPSTREQIMKTLKHESAFDANIMLLDAITTVDYFWLKLIKFFDKNSCCGEFKKIIEQEHRKISRGRGGRHPGTTSSRDTGTGSPQPKDKKDPDTGFGDAACRDQEDKLAQLTVTLNTSDETCSSSCNESVEQAFNHDGDQLGDAVASGDQTEGEEAANRSIIGPNISCSPGDNNLGATSSDAGLPEVNVSRDYQRPSRLTDNFNLDQGPKKKKYNAKKVQFSDNIPIRNEGLAGTCIEHRAGQFDSQNDSSSFFYESQYVEGIFPSSELEGNVATADTLIEDLKTAFCKTDKNLHEGVENVGAETDVDHDSEDADNNMDSHNELRPIKTAIVNIPENSAGSTECETEMKQVEADLGGTSLPVLPAPRQEPHASANNIVSFQTSASPGPQSEGNLSENGSQVNVMERFESKGFTSLNSSPFDASSPVAGSSFGRDNQSQHFAGNVGEDPDEETVTNVMNRLPICHSESSIDVIALGSNQENIVELNSISPRYENMPCRQPLPQVGRNNSARVPDMETSFTVNRPSTSLETIPLACSQEYIGEPLLSQDEPGPHQRDESNGDDYNGNDGNIDRRRNNDMEVPREQDLISNDLSATRIIILEIFNWVYSSWQSL
ncbi:uncharacterized protein LOC101850227 [Aplysia californica]|uniref:Uncharacterized protein LOC101850227 n=1 Tax=Aplysia californica TaxID=6500 RepID=A0ABM0KAA8_APLCA|nr:uncharacterized protein LOC101850227 [Aplysia californica]